MFVKDEILQRTDTIFPLGNKWYNINLRVKASISFKDKCSDFVATQIAVNEQCVFLILNSYHDLLQ